MKLRVQRIETVGDDVKLFEFTSHDGKVLPAFESGAHVQLHLRPGLSRQYSLVSDPQDRTHYAVAVLRQERGQGSTWLHEELRLGAELEASGPVNGFPLTESKHTMLIAGGIGITPILSHARALARRGSSFELHYAARTPGRLALRQTIEQIAGRNARYYASRSGARFLPRDLLTATPRDAHIYVCGPTRLINDVRAAAIGLGWSPELIHFESFGAIWETDDELVDLELANSGIKLQVPVGQTLLEAMEAAGIWVPNDCRRGECHMCMTEVLAGEPIHRDHCLTPEERSTSMTPCVSWAKRRHLVLAI